MNHFTLCLVLDLHTKKILLGKKKRSLGKGKWNGFGGKVEAGECVEEAAVRELREECGLVVLPADLRKMAENHFLLPNHENPFFRNGLIHVFVAVHWGGIPEETEEMQPAWFTLSQIPFSEMWADDSYWLPLVLQGKKVRGFFEFHDDNETIKNHALREVTDF